MSNIFPAGSRLKNPLVQEAVNEAYQADYAFTFVLEDDRLAQLFAGGRMYFETVGASLLTLDRRAEGMAVVLKEEAPEGWTRSQMRDMFSDLAETNIVHFEYDIASLAQELYEQRLRILGGFMVIANDETSSFATVFPRYYALGAAPGIREAMKHLGNVDKLSDEELSTVFATTIIDTLVHRLGVDD